MYQDVLVPTDGGDGMATVFDHASALARSNDATVHVLSVSDTRNRFESPSSGLAGAAWTAGEEDRAAAAAADAVEALPADLTVDHVVDSGVPHKRIVAHARSKDVDVMVMGTHGRTGLDHYLVGSVAERVVRHSPVPVLTVPVED